MEILSSCQADYDATGAATTATVFLVAWIHQLAPSPLVALATDVVARRYLATVFGIPNQQWAPMSDPPYQLLSCAITRKPVAFQTRGGSAPAKETLSKPPSLQGVIHGLLAAEKVPISREAMPHRMAQN